MKKVAIGTLIALALGSGRAIPKALLERYCDTPERSALWIALCTPSGPAQPANPLPPFD